MSAHPSHALPLAIVRELGTADKAIMRAPARLARFSRALQSDLVKVEADMRKTKVMLMAFLAGLALAAPTQTRAQRAATHAPIFDAVGTLLDLPAGVRVWIAHAATPDSDIAAEGGEFVYPGDHVRVRGGLAQVQIEGLVRPVEITEASSPYVVPTTTRRSAPEAVREFLAAVSLPLAPRSFLRRRPTSGRGTAEPGEAGRRAAPLSSSPASPVGEIVVPRSLDHLTITWCGDAAYGEAHSAKDIALVEDNGGYGRVTSLSRPRVDSIVVHDRGSNAAIEFSVSRVEGSSFPRPKGFDGADPESRTALALWYLTKADAKYRSYGLTLLDDQKYELAAAAAYFSAATMCPTQLEDR